MRGAPAPATASADHSGDNGIAPEPGLGGGPGMGAAIMRGYDLDVLALRSAVTVLVLDSGIRKLHMPIVIRQLVLRAQRAISSAVRSGRPFLTVALTVGDACHNLLLPWRQRATGHTHSSSRQE